MTAAEKLVEIRPEKKRSVKAKLELIQPTHIVDVWRLVERSLIDGKQSYPDLTEDQPEAIRSHLFAYMQHPLFTGIIARVGKRPVGALLGDVRSRAYGRPSRFAFVWGFWVDPQYRKSGIGSLLWNEYAARLKKAHIFHFEAHTNPELTEYLCRESGIQVKPLLQIVGGKL